MQTGLNAGGLRVLCGNEVIKRVRPVRDANADVVDGGARLFHNGLCPSAASRASWRVPLTAFAGSGPQCRNSSSWVGALCRACLAAFKMRNFRPQIAFSAETLQTLVVWQPSVNSASAASLSLLLYRLREHQPRQRGPMGSIRRQPAAMGRDKG